MNNDLPHEGGDLANQRLNLSGLLTRSGQAYRIAVLNANIPVERLQQREPLELVRHWINHNFDQAEWISHQLNATYLIRHQNTGEIRLWAGSFSPRFSQTYAWTRSQPYQSENFVNDILRDTKPTDIEVFLSLANPGSAWQFYKLQSVIISFNARLPLTNSLVRRHSFDDNRRRSRTFVLIRVDLE